MSEEKIATPEEMYQRAYDRNIAVAEMFLKQIPKPSYHKQIAYNFDFDVNATYHWVSETKEGGDIFKRVSDGGIAKFTKYSHIKLK